MRAEEYDIPPKPDFAFLSWVASKTNGANVHDSKLLRCNYEWYIKSGEIENAEKIKILWTRFLNSRKGRVRDLIGTNGSLLDNAFIDNIHDGSDNSDRCNENVASVSID